MTDNVERQLPDYLLDTAREYRTISKELKKLREAPITGFFLNQKADQFKNDMLQGDGWTGFQFFDYSSDEKKPVRGIIISNSCNISLENKRITPIYVTFAPIIELSKFRSELGNSSLSSERIDQHISEIKNQLVYKYFYLPKNENLGEECIALLDQIHSIPFSNITNKNKLFTLSQSGFYRFIMKLSILFCRLHENIERK